MELHLKYKSLLNSYHINTDLRLAHFFSQLEHESNLKPISENLNYSANRLLVIFPKYFTKDSLDKNNKVVKGTATLYARKPERIANRVYANRMGNGNEQSGDGWKYRGRGFIQLTGKDNYRVLSKDVRIDFLENPDLLLEEANAMISALWFWNKNKLNDLADKDNVVAITKRINGATNGLADRKAKLAKWKLKLK